MRLRNACTWLVGLSVGAFACGGSDPIAVNDAPDARVDASQVADTGSTRDSGAADSAAPDAGANDSGGAVVDPRVAGGAIAVNKDITLTAASTGTSLPVRAYYPQGVSGALPTIVLLHGYLISPRNYDGYAERLATHGFLVLNVDYPAALGNGNVVADSKNALGAVDALIAAPQQLPVQVDITKLGMLGHSRGGKAALLAAAGDVRVKTAVLLDPVDAKPPVNCNAVTECPSAADAIAQRSVPLLYLGETLDGAAGFGGMACAATDTNYQSIYKKSQSPATALTLLGASHMSFLSTSVGCGFACLPCKAATMPAATALDISYAVTVAFMRKELRGEAAMATYVNGASAQAQYAATVTFESK